MNPKACSCLLAVHILSISLSTLVAQETANQSQALPIEVAFRQVVAELSGRVDLLDTNLVLTITRASRSWAINGRIVTPSQTNHFAVNISDRGLVELKGVLSSTGSAQPRLQKASKPESTSISPDAAFKLGIETLARYGVKPSSTDNRGRIKFKRADVNEWFMDIAGYSGMRLEGYWVTVTDASEVTIRNAM